MDPRRKTDDELIAALKEVAKEERGRIVWLLRLLNEMDQRRVAHKRGFPSLFEYCVKELRYAEGEAARRIHASRAAADYPILYLALARGVLTLTVVSMLRPHLTRGNHRGLIRAALGRSTREVEALISRLSPCKEPRERARLITPVVSPGAHSPPPSTVSALPGGEQELPIGPLRVHFSFTAGKELLDAVEKAKGFLSAKYGEPGFEEVFTEAVSTLIDRLDPAKRALRRRRRFIGGDRRGTRNPRRVPRAIRDEVWLRDGGRCAYVSAEGRRCEATSALQYDHVTPWARGGRSDDPANVRLLCRAHNGLEARRAFGDEKVDAAIAARKEAGAATSSPACPATSGSPTLG